MMKPPPPRKRNKKSVVKKLAGVYGQQYSAKDLAIAYAVHERTWSGLFGGRYDIVGECFIWNGDVNENGYGLKKLLHHEVRGPFETVLAHRLSFAFDNGFDARPFGSGKLKLSDGVIDHICNNKRCMNPRHLRVLSGYDNLARARRG